MVKGINSSIMAARYHSLAVIKTKNRVANPVFCSLINSQEKKCFIITKIKIADTKLKTLLLQFDTIFCMYPEISIQKMPRINKRKSAFCAIFRKSMRFPPLFIIGLILRKSLDANIENKMANRYVNIIQHWRKIRTLLRWRLRY